MTRTHKALNLAGVLLPFVGLVAAVVVLWGTELVGWTDLAILAGMYTVTCLGVTLGFHRLFTHRSYATYRPVQYALAIIGSMAVEDPVMRRIDRLFPLWVALGLVIPFGLGHLIDGTLAGACAAFLWGGLARVFLLHHVTWSINSVCHFFGSRRFAVDDHSTNVFWLAVLSMGESWHHNHHAFPRSARHGLRWWEVDPTAYAIRGLRALRLAWNVVEISPERQAEKASRPAVPA